MYGIFARISSCKRLISISCPSLDGLKVVTFPFSKVNSASTGSIFSFCITGERILYSAGAEYEYAGDRLTPVRYAWKMMVALDSTSADLPMVYAWLDKSVLSSPR